MFHHGDALPAGDAVLRGQSVDVADAVERCGVGTEAGEGDVVDTFDWEWEGGCGCRTCGLGGEWRRCDGCYWWGER